MTFRPNQALPQTAAAILVLRAIKALSAAAAAALGRSEDRHQLKTERSESFRGGLGQPARKLLPGGSKLWRGGTLGWTMKVDPEGQNYPTVKLWGSDKNAVLALKHGETCLFINFYYRSERGVNRVARVFELNPDTARLATVRTEVKVISSGETYVRPDWIDFPRGVGLPPPGEPIHQAWAGEKMPIAKRPEDAKFPKYGAWGPFVGKAAFYSLQYGDYLIGMNTTEDRSYDLPVPPSFRRAPDLVSGKELELTGGVKVPPLATVVLYLGKPKASGR